MKYVWILYHLLGSVTNGHTCENVLCGSGQSPAVNFCKMVPKYIGCGDEDWIHLAQDWDQWQASADHSECSASVNSGELIHQLRDYKKENFPWNQTICLRMKQEA